MGLTVRELVTKWSFDVDAKGLDRAKQGIDNIKGAIKTASIIGTAAAATLFGFAKSAANAGDRAAKTARSLGISADSLQEFTHAASIGGITFQEMGVGLRTLAKTVNEARTGSQQYIDSLTQMGLSADIINNKSLSTEDIILAIADNFKKMPDGIEKTALATEVFGRAGSKMITMLNEGSEGINKLRKEARDLGIVLDKDARDKSEKFNDEMHRMVQVFVGIKNAIGIGLLPTLTNVFTSIREWSLANKELIKTNVDKFINVLIKLLKNIINIFKVVYKVTDGLVQIFGGWENAISLAVKAFTLLISAKMIFGLGQIAMSLKSILGVITAINISAFAIPAAIGAAIAATILILQDFYAWWKGEDSVIGRLFGERGKAFEETTKSVSKTVVGGLKIFDEKVQSGWDTVKEKTSGFFGNIKSGIGSIWEQSQAKAGELLGENKPNGIAEKIQATSQALSIGSQPNISNMNTSNNPTNININSPITVSVPPNTPKDLIGTSISSGITDAFNGMLREGSRSVATPILR